METKQKNVKQQYNHPRSENTYQVTGIGVLNETDLKAFLECLDVSSDKIQYVVSTALRSGFASFYDGKQGKSTKVMKLKFI